MRVHRSGGSSQDGTGAIRLQAIDSSRSLALPSLLLEATLSPMATKEVIAASQKAEKKRTQVEKKNCVQMDPSDAIKVLRPKRFD